MPSIQEVIERGVAAFNAHDAKSLEADLADDCTVSAPGGMTYRGRAQCMEFQRVWWDGFPDAKANPTKIHYAGSVAVEEGVFEGTHTGTLKSPMGDVPPTGRKVRGEYVSVFDVRDGKVVAQRLTFDRLLLLEQLGLVPAQTATR